MESFDHAIRHRMIGCSLYSNNSMRCFQSVDSNCEPRSVVMVEGIPKREIHPCRKALATVSAVMSGMGMASPHRVKRSIQVRRFILSTWGGVMDQ